ncbi:hypothetical protein PV328_004119 [Microctonus aethiopoides]|uniref:Uncharacterized protein n=1 Tax=Microctonus aethiopoides TaxID=144406 RepID=A0AA39F9V0_9HYME|nr:hypothetical protein PV328_004119 [Microctonus aethiopoides]
MRLLTEKGLLSSIIDISATNAPTENQRTKIDGTIGNIHEMTNVKKSSQWSQNIVIETGHCQDQLNTRHTINVIVNNKKREYQQRYRGRNRDKLKQREAERRRRLQNAEIITELSTSSNIEFTELVHEPIIDEISANSQNVAGLENIQHLFVEVSQQNERGQSSANGTEITNYYVFDLLRSFEGIVIKNLSPKFHVGL